MNLDPGCFSWMEDDGPKPGTPQKTKSDVLEIELANELKRKTGQGDGYCRDSAREFLIFYQFLQYHGCGPSEADAVLSERARVVSLLQDMIAARCRHLDEVAPGQVMAHVFAIKVLQDALDMIDDDVPECS